MASDTTEPPNLLAASYLRPEQERQCIVRAAETSGAVRPAQNELCTCYWATYSYVAVSKITVGAATSTEEMVPLCIPELQDIPYCCQQQKRT
jgi:hypothetical protein